MYGKYIKTSFYIYSINLFIFKKTQKVRFYLDEAYGTNTMGKINIDIVG